MTRAIENDKFIPMLLDVLKETDGVPLPVAGNSMSPFLVDQRDKVMLSRLPEDRQMKVGDIVLFLRDNGQYVLHRLYRQDDTGVYFIGDGQYDVEGPLSPSCMLAVAESAVRKGRPVKAGDFWWDFFAKRWIRMNAREKKMLRKMYGIICK